VCNLGVGVDVEAIATVYRPAVGAQVSNLVAQLTQSSTRVERGLETGMLRFVIYRFSPVPFINWTIHFFYIKEKENILPPFNKISTQDQRAMLVGPNLLCHLRLIVSIKI
jgi:hypothetical protein